MGFDVEGWRGSKVEVATVHAMSRDNFGMVWGDCLHQALRTELSSPYGLTSPSPGGGLLSQFHVVLVGLSFLHQALRTGLSSPFGLTSPSPGAGLWSRFHVVWAFFTKPPGPDCLHHLD